MSDSDGRPGDTTATRAGIARAYAVVEDVVYVGLGVFLTALVLLLTITAFIGLVKSALAWTVLSSVSVLLDQILLILLLVELLYTVQVSFREHALLPEPFLLVGLISVIRRILVLTAAMGEQHQHGEAPQPVLVLELAVLAALILAIAIALVLLRRRDLARAAPRN